jgi:hypothetical protein
MASTSVADEGQFAPQIVVVVSPHPEAKQFAAQIATTMHCAVKKPIADHAELTRLEIAGVVFFDAPDSAELGNMMKKGFQKAQCLQVVFVFLNCTDKGLEITKAGDMRKAKGIMGGLKKAASKAYDCFELECSADCSPSDWIPSLTSDLPDVARLFSRLSVTKDIPLQDISIFFFITIAGIGKNFLVKYLEDLPDDQFDNIFGPRPHFRCMETDTIQNVTGEYSKMFNDPTCKTLLVNRNFPPNSWRGFLKELRVKAKEFKRRVLFRPLMPILEGRSDNAFSLRELAVCVSAVQCRLNHPTRLDETSGAIPSVMTMFFNTFKSSNGVSGIDASVEAMFGTQPVKLPMFNSQRLASLPRDIDETMEEMVRVNYDTSPPDTLREMNAKIRAMVDAHGDALTACRLHPSDTIRVLRKEKVPVPLTKSAARS